MSSRIEGIAILLEEAHRKGRDLNKHLKTLSNAVRDLEASEQVAAPYRDAAKAKLHNEGVIEIDDDATVSVSESEDHGAYVQAWLWVSDDMLKP